MTDGGTRGEPEAPNTAWPPGVPGVPMPPPGVNRDPSFGFPSIEEIEFLEPPPPLSDAPTAMARHIVAASAWPYDLKKFTKGSGASETRILDRASSGRDFSTVTMPALVTTTNLRRGAPKCCVASSLLNGLGCVVNSRGAPTGYGGSRSRWTPMGGGISPTEPTAEAARPWSGCGVTISRKLRIAAPLCAPAPTPWYAPDDCGLIPGEPI